MSKAKTATAQMPAQGKVLANVSVLTREDRARAGITDEMAEAMAKAGQPEQKGVQVVRGPFQPDAEHDVEEQVRVIDYDANTVLFSGSEADLAKLVKAATSTPKPRRARRAPKEG